MDPQARSRSAATLGVLALIVVIAVLWALHKVTSPFPEKAAPAPICEDTTVSAGQTVQTGQVLVNVLNAGGKAGLAQSVLASLGQFGFAPGKLGNAADDVHHGIAAQVWSSHPHGAAARLVASYLGPDVTVKRHASDYLGITVVVGDSFQQVHRGMASIKAAGDTTVCEPTTVNEGL